MKEKKRAHEKVAMLLEQNVIQNVKQDYGKKIIFFFSLKKIMICNNILEEGLSSFQNRYLYLKMFCYDVSITIIIMST